MDRQTRRANFKKLQQPPTTTTTTSSTKQLRRNAGTATTTLSNYFNSPELPSNVEASDLESTEEEPKVKKTRESQDIETVPAKPKKAPKLKTNPPSRRGRSGGRGRSKQQPSISDFLRNEQLFAEVTAQHCMADNFSPDDIEMALALSKSEAEKYGRLRLQDTEDEEQDGAVNLLSEKGNQSAENIRRKLQKYGFRTAAKEEYNLFNLASKRGRNKRGERCKWSNKFTPLTLRNPSEQQKKLEKKIATLMAQQVRTKLPSPKELFMAPFNLVSSRLKAYETSSDTRITHEPEEGPLKNPSAYYVEELIDTSSAPAHHLLKKWAAIPGRDLSPKRLNEKSMLRQQQLEQVYAELEALFGEKAELDELEKQLADNMIREETQTQVKIGILDGSPLKEPPDKRAKMMQSRKETCSEKENQKPSSSCLSNLTVPTQSTRCTSPDLFADSDSDNEPEIASPLVMSESVEAVENTSSTEIKCYEIYSSDEVKTTADTNSTEVPKGESIIDLSQEPESPELLMNATTSKPLLEQPIFSLSPSLEFEQEIDMLATDSTTKQAEDLDELYVNYSLETSQDKQDFDLNERTESHNSFNFSLTNSTKSPQEINSFNLSSRNSVKSSISTASISMSTNSPNIYADRSFTLSQVGSPKVPFQRSFSLTQTSKQSFQVEHSFKSPLSHKSNSLADASIDLTQDSSDEDIEDNEGVLLSDDEINYSIWKADNTFRQIKEDFDKSSSTSDSDNDYRSPMTKLTSVPYFKTVEDLDAYLDSSPAASIKSCNSRSPNKSALSKERAEFGILDAAHSQPFMLSQEPESSQVHIDWAEASFLDSPTEVPLKRLSTGCNHKFKELLTHVSKPIEPELEPESETFDDEFDEFDRLVLQNKKDSTISGVTETLPSGLDQLLRGEINMEPLPGPVESVTTQKNAVELEKLELNGQVYNIRVCHTPKPDFVSLSESELMQQLYNYGIKPLKRKQAVKLLEFIYNQTHPIMLPLQEEPSAPSVPLPRSKSTPVQSATTKHTPVTGCSTSKSSARLLSTEDCLTPTELDPKLNYKFREASGADLLRFSQTMPPALCDDFEFYVLQTNVTKKTPQPLVPLHIAWHNLLCANPILHESVLMYEPIDLQEIYLYLKQLGYRYDPRDLKSFCDKRCIIFRYELAPPTKQVQRHIRKKPKKPSSKI